MFSNLSRRITNSLCTALQSIRTFVPRVNGMSIFFVLVFIFNTNIILVPRVFEPLPKKRNGENVLSFLQKQLLQKYDPTGKRRALVDQDTGLRSGDVIKVTYLDRTNVIGQVIAIKRSVNSVGTNILIRNKINKIGCEVRIPLFNPNIRNIEVVHKPKKYMPRRKHFYIRNTKYDVGDVELLVRKEAKKHK